MTAVRANLEAMEAHFAGATCPEAVFGSLTGTVAEKEAAVRAQYRSLSRTCHPDLASPVDAGLATGVFSALTRWQAVAQKKIDAGTYGDGEPYIDIKPTPPYTPTDLTVRGKSLRLTGLLGEGVFASVHAAEYEGSAPHWATFAKYARDGADNDLLEREYQALKAFAQPDADRRAERDFYSKQRNYVPSPVTTFALRDADGARHRVNVLAVPASDCYTAATLRTSKFPDGLEPRHVWWIFRRMLLTAWMAHLRGFVHGGITPDHVLVFPQAHGIVLLDWTCAAHRDEEPVPAVDPAWEGYYPPETLRKEKARPAADLFTMAATAVYLLGGDPIAHRIPATVPAPLCQALLRCLDPVARRRPQDAERFHHELGALLDKEGGRTYAELVVP